MGVSYSIIDVDSTGISCDVNTSKPDKLGRITRIYFSLIALTCSNSNRVVKAYPLRPDIEVYDVLTHHITISADRA